MLACAALASCVKSEIDSSKQMTFYAGFGSSTKTVLTSSYGIEWQEGDAISINGNKFTTAQSGETVEFTGEEFSADAYMAVYPFASAVSIDAAQKTAQVTIPATQSAVQDSFDPAANASVAYSTDKNLNFKNLGAVLCVDLTQYQNIVSVKISPASAEAKLAGQFGVSLDDSNLPTITDRSNAVSDVVLTIDNAKVLPQGKYYVAVAPGTYEGGLKVTLTNTRGESGEFPFASLASLQRAYLYNVALTNPNYFTYIRYGNNLGLPNDGTYPSQFMSIVRNSVEVLRVVGQRPKSTDYSGTGGLVITSVKNGAFGSIQASGNFNVKNTPTKASSGSIIVTATGGTGISAYTVYEPIFTVSLVDPVVVFKPFAVKANPQTGGSVPVNLELDPSIDRSQLIIDWRRNFKYYNVGGPASHKDGTLAKGTTNDVPSDPDMMLAKIWSNYYTAIRVSPNYGSNDPIYWFTNNLNNRTPNSPLYLEPTDAGFNAVVNPEKWYIDGEYANGIFTGQMTYVTNGDRSAWASGTQLTDQFFVYIAK